MESIRTIRRLLTVVLFVLLATPAFAADDYFPPPDSEGGWRTLSDAADIRKIAGMDLVRLDQAYALTERSTPNGGLVVVRHGYLVYEKYFGRAHRNANPDMASTGKAFTSIACGIMLKEFKDKIPDGLDTKVFTEKYLPEAFPLDDPRKANITLGQLLCMTAGYNGEGQSPTGVVMGKASPMKPAKGQDIRDLDKSSLRVPLWTDPGAGYSYSSPAPHIASIVLRRVTGMELQDYINERLAKPIGWGPWGYCLQRGDFKMPHANGAGSTALHATDAVRFGYCLVRGGRWKDKQLVPPEYLALCNKPSKFNPHSPFSLQFEHNADGHVAGAQKDAFYKSGAGGFGLIIVPSLDLVIYKLGGKDNQYDPALTGLPQPFKYDGSRDNWQPIPASPFHEGSLGGDNGLRRVLEMVSGAVVD
ncbi:serine hydrolase domain-containing protein [Humisphaera borealis]|uniref:Beta-lactamase family protein n=1 Tax=Humisphaera borealis TaxID=2807512 RepID=A0A7M2X477_9BACT|nr:serine hydrolase domain-containing protein [Humisphaera borealis]QOV91841.1 beta-lactamase family protein [Humisphaera borealis]